MPVLKLDIVERLRAALDTEGELPFEEIGALLIEASETIELLWSLLEPRQRSWNGRLGIEGLCLGSSLRGRCSGPQSGSVDLSSDSEMKVRGQIIPPSVTISDVRPARRAFAVCARPAS